MITLVKGTRKIEDKSGGSKMRITTNLFPKQKDPQVRSGLLQIDTLRYLYLQKHPHSNAAQRLLAIALILCKEIHLQMKLHIERKPERKQCRANLLLKTQETFRRMEVLYFSL